MPPRYTSDFGSTTMPTLSPSGVVAEKMLSVALGSSAHSNTYVKPVHPPPRTPTRIRAFGVPRLVRCFAISCAAATVTSTSFLEMGAAGAFAVSLWVAVALIFSPRLLMLLPVVLDRRLDGIFCEDRAVDLDRREVELLDDLRVLDLGRLLERHAFDHLGRERARRDRRAATEGLELRIRDLAVDDLDLQTHHVAARGRADQAGADIIGLVLGKRADVARVVVVIENFF